MRAGHVEKPLELHFSIYTDMNEGAVQTYTALCQFSPRIIGLVLFPVFVSSEVLYFSLEKPS